MAIKEKIGKHEYWHDGEGLLVPLKHVSKQDQERDALVNELVADARKLEALIKAFKAQMSAKIDRYLEAEAASYGENWQGNARIRDFTQVIEVEVSNAKLLTFDETLNIAKSKIDNCIARWAPGARTEIIALVNQAFRVNQKGQMDVKALLKLPQLQIEDEEWQAAMAIIQDSVTVAGTRRYINFRERGDDDRWSSIQLNFSAV